MSAPKPTNLLRQLTAKKSTPPKFSYIKVKMSNGYENVFENFAIIIVFTVDCY